MKSIRTTFALFAALLPILYFGGMAWYLWGAPGRMESATGLPSGLFGGEMMKQLGPTVLGLAGIAMLFAFGFAIRVVRASSRMSTTLTAASVDPEPGEPFDADAALARYMARKAAGGEAFAATPDPAVMAAHPAARGFGRKAV